MQTIKTLSLAAAILSGLAIAVPSSAEAAAQCMNNTRMIVYVSDGDGGVLQCISTCTAGLYGNGEELSDCLPAQLA